MRLPYSSPVRPRRGLVVYQLVLMLLAIIIIIVALLYFARRQQPTPAAPADTAPSVGLLYHPRPGGPGGSFMV